MYNIKQLTNFDVKDNQIEYKDIKRGPVPVDNYPYRIIPYNQLLGLVGSSNDIVIEINKLGYCTNDNEGKDYPIFIKFSDNIERKFHIGKTGMFEFQPEEWINVNEKTEDGIFIQREEATVSVKKILVPDNVPFVLDYCYKV